jgi:hypothetical protein
MSELTQWYGCRVCGERRRFPFEANSDDPGCRCAPAGRVRSVEAPALPSDRRAVEGSDLGGAAWDRRGPRVARERLFAERREVDLVGRRPSPSSTGKMLVVASTRGNQKSAIQIDGRDVYLGVNTYVMPSRRAAGDGPDTGRPRPKSDRAVILQREVQGHGKL